MPTKLEKHVTEQVLKYQGLDLRDHGAKGLLVMQAKNHSSGFFHAIEVLQELFTCNANERKGIDAAIEALRAYAFDEDE